MIAASYHRALTRGVRLETILETLADWGTKTKDLDVLTEYVRNALRRTICHQYATPQAGGKLKLTCITLDPALEDLINAYIDRGPGGTTLTMPGDVDGRYQPAASRATNAACTAAIANAEALQRRISASSVPW